ncbi:MAG TPA: hypothetical protein DDY59_11470 [Lachnospiraceae bacterium]|jgi:hypothetical protein|nr:hypothetical protein [Lachnospiraceae bacterium]HCA70899.1 hypothetical protein [Lachnospiraceae bacterium]
MLKKVVFFIFIIGILAMISGCNIDENPKREKQEVQEPEKAGNPAGKDTEPKAEGEEEMDTGIQWDQEAITVYQPKKGGVWYPRMYQLKSRTILCGFDTNEDGGRAVVKCVASKDGGLTWSSDAVQVTDLPEYDCANTNFIELENGDIWAAYRANEWEGEEYYSSIRVNVSRDGGRTWGPHSIVTEEKGTGGVYEPHFGYLGEKIAVFYANDSLNAVSDNRQQNIEFKLWEGNTWSEKIIASDGTKTFSRDGMPVWCRLEDDSFCLVIESTSLAPSAEFIIQMKNSPDGLDWSEKLKNIYIPKGRGKKAGAPYIERLKDGRVAVSFQTDEDATENGDARSKMKVILSTDASASEFLPASVPFNTPDGYCSNWNALLSYEEYLFAVTSTNYPTTGILMKRGLVK